MQDLSADYASVFKEKKYRELVAMAEAAQLSLTV
jgi:hypothetical protein